MLRESRAAVSGAGKYIEKSQTQHWRGFQGKNALEMRVNAGFTFFTDGRQGGVKSHATRTVRCFWVAFGG
jgi:hypothetical protein